MGDNSIGSEIRKIRTQKGLSMEALSEMSGISLRTIQRVEQGESSPRGYTLLQLSEALDFEMSELILLDKDISSEEIEKLKWLNVSALLIIFLPLANLIVPLLLWRKNRQISLVKTTGSRIVNFQIVWTIATSLALIIAPFTLLFFEQPWLTSIGTVIFTYLALYSYNIFMTLRAANQIHHQRWAQVLPKVPVLL